MASRDYNPLSVFLQLESDMRRTAESTLRSVLFQPCVDVYESADALHLVIELAGVSPDRLNLTLSADDRYLIVSGERVEPHAGSRRRVRCYQLEVYYGPFEREIQLPSEVKFDRERIGANYRDGLLLIALPKRAEPAAAKRTIEVTGE